MKLRAILGKITRFPVDFVAVIATILVASPAHAEISRCQSIFAKPRVEIRNLNLLTNNFNIGRGLHDYDSHFPYSPKTTFRKTIQALPQGSMWIDMGAGSAKAMIEGLMINRQIRGLAIAYKRPRVTADQTLSRWNADVATRFEYVEGDYVENLVRDGILDFARGRVRVISDLYGPFSYSEQLPNLLQSYVDLLAKDGVLYVNYMTSRLYEDPSVGQRVDQAVNSVQRGETNDPDGLLTWLMKIPGLRISEIRNFDSGGAHRERSTALRIEKVADHVVVPRTLLTTKYKEGSPPERNFRIDF